MVQKDGASGCRTATNICKVNVANYRRNGAILISLTKKDFKIHYLYARIFVIKHIFRNFAAVLGKRGSLENPIKKKDKFQNKYFTT